MEKGHKTMQKEWRELTLIQQLKINRWFNKYDRHYQTLCSIGVVDLISLGNYELLMSFFKTEEGCNTATRILDKHGTDYILYNNVIFRL